MSSLVHCLLEEADARMFANITETAERANKKISSRTIDSDGSSSGHTAAGSGKL